MWARVARFEGDPADIDARVEKLQTMLDAGQGPIDLADAKFLMLVDRASGGMLGVTLFESEEAMWKGDAAACIGHLGKSQSGTLGDPKISEAGRKFLADLLLQLTDQQLRDLFEVARVDQRSRRPNSAEPPASVDEWVTVFKHKRDEIVSNRCSS